MDDRESLIRLGTYLGVIKDGDTARQLVSLMKPESAMGWLSASAEALKKAATAEACNEAVRIICETDYEVLSPRSRDPAESLAREVYDQLAEEYVPGEELQPFEVFCSYFRESMRRVETTLRGILYTTGIRREIISLENPAAFEAIAELKHLPGRRYGGTALAHGSDRQVAALARYIGILLDRYEEKCIGRDTCSEIREMLDRLSAYPGYFAMLERERKVVSARALTQAVEKLRRYPGDAQDKADLILALSIVLFTIFPSAELIRYIAKLRPGPANRYLQHEHSALLALNFLLMGKADLAAKFAGKAYEMAQDANTKAYVCLLTGCIQVHLRNYDQAIKAFDAGLDAADRQTRSLIMFYRGVLLYEMGQVGLALNSFRDSRAGCMDESDIMALCNNIGTCHMATGNLGVALQAFEEADDAFPYSGRLTARRMRSITWSSMGIIYMSMREHELAATYFRKALRASREAGDGKGVANQLGNLGLVHKSRAEYGMAASHFTSALNYSCSIEYLEGILYSLEQLRQVLALDCRHGAIRPIEKDVIRRHPGFSGLLMARRR